jgi:ribonuclease VapC
MFLDTSAIVEMLTGGPRARELSLKVDAAETPFYCGPTVEFEATAVLATALRCPVEGANLLVMELLADLNAVRMTITPEIGEKAIAAMARYGKGRGHPAQLNFGDCFVYALAEAAQVPLLYVGNDFSKTDLA